MRRRILLAILAITALAVALFGIPLGIVVRHQETDEATLRLERQATLASLIEERFDAGRSSVGPRSAPRPAAEAPVARSSPPPSPPRAADPITPPTPHYTPAPTVAIPVISIGPILAVPGVRDALVERRERVVGVSPIIAGRPVKGPADRLMGPLGIDVSCVGVAREYRSFCSALVIDTGDAAHAGEIEALGVHAVVADTLMTDARVAAALARDTLAAVA